MLGAKKGPPPSAGPQKSFSPNQPQIMTQPKPIVIDPLVKMQQ